MEKLNNITFRTLEVGFQALKETDTFEYVKSELEMINIHEDDSAEVQTELVRIYLDYVTNGGRFDFTTKTKHYNLILEYAHNKKLVEGLEVARQDLLINRLTDIMCLGVILEKLGE